MKSFKNLAIIFGCALLLFLIGTVQAITPDYRRDNEQDDPPMVTYSIATATGTYYNPETEVLGPVGITLEEHHSEEVKRKKQILKRIFHKHDQRQQLATNEPNSWALE